MVPPEDTKEAAKETEPTAAKKAVSKSGGLEKPKDDTKSPVKTDAESSERTEPGKGQSAAHPADPGKAEAPAAEPDTKGPVTEARDAAVKDDKAKAGIKDDAGAAGPKKENANAGSASRHREGGRPGTSGPQRSRDRGGDRPRRRPERKDTWEPKTRLGLLVRDGKITTMSDALQTGYPLREPEIIDVLLPDLDDEVLDVNMVQRMTDSGRRVRFAIVTVVGNGDGYVGLGKATGKEVGPAIRKAIDNAKLNIIEIKRGCGSWECGCGEPHSIPFVVKGKSGSVEVTFKPAPRGISLAVGDVAKHILKLAGVSDAWGFTAGKTRTTVNYAKAAFDALGKISEMRVMPEQEERLHIHTGTIGTIKEEGGTEE